MSEEITKTIVLWDLLKTTPANAANAFEQQAKDIPFRACLIWQTQKTKRDKAIQWSHITFQSMSRLINQHAWSLAGTGICKGDRVILGIKPGPEFMSVIFALYKLGAIPVMIDPGMGRKSMLKCIQKVNAKAIIGSWKIHLFRMLHKKEFSTIKIHINSGDKSFAGILSLKDLQSQKKTKFPNAATLHEDSAAILFTSGSTGTPKGVVYTHGMFENQIKLIKKTYDVQTNDIDFSIFPLFSLFAVSMGMTTVVPIMDYSKPVHVNPAFIYQIIEELGVSFSFASPIFWNRIADYCKTQNKDMPSLRAILMAGCTVAPSIHRNFLEGVLPATSDIFVPYGATESLPLTSVKGSEILINYADKTENGEGIYVGKKITEDIGIIIIKITDQPIKTKNDATILKAGEIGEIAVTGVVVSKEYYEEDEANSKSKFTDENGQIWHRMGDLGYFDKNKGLWFCGRKADRIEIGDDLLLTDQFEEVFNQHKTVKRSAIVAVSAKPYLIVQPISELNNDEEKALIKDLLNIAEKRKETAHIQDILFLKDFPVDARHNAKIKRDVLAEWIQNK